MWCGTNGLGLLSVWFGVSQLVVRSQRYDRSSIEARIFRNVELGYVFGAARIYTGPRLFWRISDTEASLV